MYQYSSYMCTEVVFFTANGIVKDILYLHPCALDPSIKIWYYLILLSSSTVCLIFLGINSPSVVCASQYHPLINRSIAGCMSRLVWVSSILLEEQQIYLLSFTSFGKNQYKVGSKYGSQKEITSKYITCKSNWLIFPHAMNH